MKSLFKRFSIGNKKNEPTDYTSTTTTTTTMTRYENGVPVEVITKTITTDSEPNDDDVGAKLVEEPNNTVDNEIEEVVTAIKKIEVITGPADKKTEDIVEKPVDKPDKKTEEREQDRSVRQGERTDPASRCTPIVDMNEFKKHLDLTDYDFSRVDDHARKTPNKETENFTRLSKYLTEPWNEDLDKLRCIFVWIAENISYDTDAFFGGNIKSCGPDDVLKTRKAVCQGYAELFEKMAKEAGLNVWKISGKSKGAGYSHGCDIDSRQFDHAWNGTLYKGEYLLIDNTWGAGFLNGMKFERRLEPFYFLCSPTQFIYSHFPENPEHQYIEPKLSKEEFIDLTYVKPKFFTSGLNFVEHLGNEIEVSDDKVEIEIERINPDESKPLHAVLEWKGHEDIIAFIQRLDTPGPRGGRKYKLSFACPSKGEGDFNIYVMLEGNSGPMVSSLKVKNSGSGKNFVQPIKMFDVPFSFTIHNPIHEKLKHNDRIKFEITVFDLPESELPSLALFSPDKDVRDLQKVSSKEDSTTFAIETSLDQKGKWGLTYRTQELSFSFIAQYIVE